MDKRRKYGYDYDSRPEDYSRCAVSVTGNERWSKPSQCSRPRGPDGLRCKQHAKMEARVPDEGGWVRHLQPIARKEWEKAKAALLKAQSEAAQAVAAVMALEAGEE